MQGFHCTGCGAWHPHLPMSFHIEAPDAWTPNLIHAEGCALGSDDCVIHFDQLFVRGILCVPVAGIDEPFEFGVWVALAEADFDRVSETWDTPGRELMPPVPGELANDIWLFDQPTSGQRVLLHVRPVGLRPHVRLVDDGHPLALEQRDGLSRDALVQRVAQLLHGA